MTQDNMHETEFENGQLADSAENAVNKPKNFKKAALIALPIGVAVLGVYIFKTQIGESLIGGYLKSKAIDSDIKISSLGLNGAKFDKLNLSKNGQTSLAIKDGVLKWHFKTPFNPEIDSIKAASLYLNLAYNEKGLDFGALSEFFKPSEKKSTLSIHSLAIDELFLDLKTQYGDILGYGKINGSFDDGIKGEVDYWLPQSITKERTKVRHNFATNSLNNKDRFILGNEILLDKVSLAENFMKGIQLENLGGRLVFSVIKPADQESGIKFKFLDTVLSAKKFKSGEFDLNNANANIKNGWLNLGNKPNTDSVFDFSGNFDGTFAQFAKNSIKDFAIDYSIARAKEGNLRIDFDGKTLGINSAISANGAKLSGVFNLLLQDFNKPSEIKGDGFLNTALFALNGKIISDLKNNLKETALSSLLEKPNISSRFGLELNDSILKIKLAEPILLKNNGANLQFSPKSDSEISVSLSENNLNSSIGGDLKANIAGNTQISSRINSVQFTNGKLNADIAQLAAKNFKIGENHFDLNGTSAKINMANGQILSSNFSGNAISNSSNLNLKTNFSGNIKNNILALSALGYSNNFKFGEISGNGTKFDLNAKGNIKNKINIIGNINSNKIKSKTFDIANAKTQFDANLNTKNLSTQIDAHLDIGNLNSNNLSMTRGNFDTIGTLNPRAPLNYNGNISGNVAKMRIEDNEINNATIKGPIQFQQYGSNFALNTKSCLALDFAEYIANGLALKSSSAKVCPDNKSRLLALNSGRTSLYGTALIDNASLTMGSGSDATKIILNDFNGHFVPSKNNVISFAGRSNNLELQFKTAPQNLASIISKNAVFELINTSSGTQIKANLGELSSKGLPVSLFGTATGQFSANDTGLSGAFNIQDVLIQDIEKVKRFENFIVSGQGELNNNKVNIYGDAVLESKSINAAQIFFNHDLNTQTGGVIIDAPSLEFGTPLLAYNNQTLQAKDIIPAISAIFGRSFGQISAMAKFEWAPATPLVSTANIAAKDLAFESSWGNIRQINGEIKIDDLLGLKTSQSQNLKIGLFDVGLPIENGGIGFTLNGANNITIDSAQWPFADGILSLVPTKIEYGNSDLQFDVKVQSIDMVKFLRLAKIPNLEIEGKMSGVLPVYLVDNSFEIRGGVLKADAGGVLRYTGPSPIAEAEKPKGIAKLKNKIFGAPPPPPAELAFKALRDLRYKILEMRIDGRTTGDATISILLEGYNPELIGGQGFRFNVKIALPLNSIMRSIDNLKKSPTQFLSDYQNK